MTDERRKKLSQHLMIAAHLITAASHLALVGELSDVDGVLGDASQVMCRAQETFNELEAEPKEAELEG